MEKRDYQVHRVRFVDFSSKTINAVAFHDDGEHSKLAVAKGDGSIEIRSRSSNWLVDYVLPGHDKRSVEHLSWCDGRLFSGSVTGHIIEWDLERLEPKYHQDSYGGAVWCLKFSHSNKSLATGCEDGGIHLFDVYKDSIMYKSCLSKQQSRILCLAWTHDDKYIFTGGFDCSMLKCDVDTGHVVQRMTTDKPTDANTMVWSLEILKDMTVIIGDSLGHTQFWDGNMCTLLQSFKSHLADVLTVAVVQAEDTVYSTGIDSAIQEFKIIEQEGAASKWTMTKSVRASKHDVRTICMCGPFNRLVAGGIDPRLVIFNLDKGLLEGRYKRYSCLPREACHLAKSANFLSFHDTHKLHVWKLSSSVSDCSSSPPVKLFEIRSPKSDHLVCSAISHDGSYAAYSNINKGQAFELIDSAVKKCSVTIPPCTHMCFTRKNELVTIGHQSIISIINVTEGTTSSAALLFPKEFTPTLPYRLLRLSNCDTYVSVVDSSSNVLVFQLFSRKHMASMPRVSDVVVDCVFARSSNSVIVVTSMKDVYEYSLESKKFEQWSLDLNTSRVVRTVFQRAGNFDLRRNTNSTNIVINPLFPDEIFLHEQDAFGKIVQNFQLPWTVDRGEMNTKEECAALFRTNDQYGELMFFDFNDAGEIVLVEQQIEKILSDLPAPLKRKIFGN